MEAIRSSKTSGTTLRTTRRHIPEDDTLQNHRCENLKSYNIHHVHTEVRKQNVLVIIYLFETFFIFSSTFWNTEAYENSYLCVVYLTVLSLAHTV
jgi:hypothetical protein